MRYLENFNSYRYLDLITEDVENPIIPESDSKEKEILEYNVLLGKLLHLYSSIPVPKRKASVALSKMIPEFDFNQDVIDLNVNTLFFHDKIRIIDYLNSLLESKEIRGDNFEGFIAGLFGGVISTSKSSKHDVTIKNVDWSIKYTEFGDFRPVIGNFKNILSKSNVIIKFGKKDELHVFDFVSKFGGLTKILDRRSVRPGQIDTIQEWESIKDSILGAIFNSKDMENFGGVITGTTNNPIPTDENPLNEITAIQLNIISKESLIQLLKDGQVSKPKSGGEDAKFSIRLTSKYRSPEYSTVKIIEFPKIPTLEELKSQFNEVERVDWGKDVFGYLTWKIRPDVFDSIKANRKHIITKLQEWDEKWDELGL
jgi:hypothetical protein